MSTSDKFVPPEPGGFVPPEEGGFVPDFLQEMGIEGDGGTPAEQEPAAQVRRKVSRRSRDQLGIVWLRGSLHIGVRRQKKSLGLWSSPTPVVTAEEFAVALDQALASLKFEGTDTYLVYEGEHFTHQPEVAPGFSASATRGYLNGRVERYTRDKGPMLWVAQPALSPKPQERSFVLHLMPQAFYTVLRRLCLARRLDLTRILPMVVPVLREMNGFPIPRGAPALVAAELAEATIIVVAQSHGPLLFSRIIHTSLEQAPDRAALEINRSALYAKQQFGVSVDRIWLVTRTGRAKAEVEAKCGGGKVVMVLPTQPDEWVASAARVVRTQPVNLVADHLRKKRRSHFFRAGLVALGWLSVLASGQHLWREQQAWRAERARLLAIEASRPELESRRELLVSRNDRFARDLRLRDELAAADLPPVAPRLLAHLAAALPVDARLDEFAVKRDEESGRWSFHCEGSIAGDEESVREALAALQQALRRGPLRIRLVDSQGGAARMSAGGQPTTERQRFTLEGTLLEG